MTNMLISLKVNNNESGNLVAIESGGTVPFEIKRVYYIYDVPDNLTRGYHVHKKNDQLIWCPHGKVEVLLDNGFEKQIYTLETPNQALIVSRGFWHEMKWIFSGSVLCVLASDKYDENDYIRNYDEFLDYVKKGYWNESEL